MHSSVLEWNSSGMCSGMFINIVIFVISILVSVFSVFIHFFSKLVCMNGLQNVTVLSSSCRLLKDSSVTNFQSLVNELEFETNTVIYQFE